jgi:pSer/pThr/pTyr-binding forkhead associated (FHA) protein
VVPERLELEIVEGPGAGRLASLEGALEVGRDPAVGFQVEDTHVEPRHVRLTPLGETVLVEDLGEPGGTFLNDSEVAAPTHMRPGDELQIGVTVLQLRSARDVAGRGTAVRPSPPPRTRDEALEEVESLLDERTKAKARTAPLALFVLVVLAVLIFLATNRF